MHNESYPAKKEKNPTWEEHNEDKAIETRTGIHYCHIASAAKSGAANREEHNERVDEVRCYREDQCRGDSWLVMSPSDFKVVYPGTKEIAKGSWYGGHKLSLECVPIGRT
jgi:hypothetical protein